MRENRHAPASLDFRRTQIQKSFDVDICASDNRLEQATLSLIYWNRMVRRMKPTITYKLGDDPQGLIDALEQAGRPSLL